MERSNGVIYVAHNPVYDEHTFKVDICRAEGNVVNIRIPESTPDATTPIMEIIIAYFAVSDVVAADNACTEKLGCYRVGDNQKLFNMPCEKLLLLISETIDTFRLYDFCSVNIEKDLSKRKLFRSLSERLSAQRQMASDAFRTQQEIKKTLFDESLSRRKKCHRELVEMIPVVKETYKDIKFLKWCSTDETATTDTLVKVLMLTDNYSKPMRLLFTRYAKATDPAKPDGSRVESRILKGKYIEDWEEEDDGRVAGASIGIDKNDGITIDVVSIRYDEYNLKWKETNVGDIECSTPEEAIEKFNAILAEYVADPIVERRSPATKSKEGARGTPVNQVNYKTKLFDYIDLDF